MVSQTDASYELHDAVATSVGWKFLRKPGNSCGLEVDGNFVKNQVTVTLRSWFIAFYNNKFICIHCHLLTPVEWRKYKRLNVEIKLNSLAEIRGYLFNFSTGVPKN